MNPTHETIERTVDLSVRRRAVQTMWPCHQARPRLVLGLWGRRHANPGLASRRKESIHGLETAVSTSCCSSWVACKLRSRVVAGRSIEAYNAQVRLSNRSRKMTGKRMNIAPQHSKDGSMPTLQTFSKRRNAPPLGTMHEGRRRQGGRAGRSTAAAATSRRLVPHVIHEGAASDVTAVAAAAAAASSCCWHLDLMDL